MNTETIESVLTAQGWTEDDWAQLSPRARELVRRLAELHAERLRAEGGAR